MMIGNRILLRKFRTQDAQEMFNLIHDEEVQKYLPGVCAKDLVEMTRFINVYTDANFIDDIYLAIVDKTTQELIGALIGTRIRSKEMEMSYFISQARRGKGLMLEALKLFLKWYKKQKIGNDLIFDVAKDNFASLKLISKLQISKVNIKKYDVTNKSIRYILYSHKL